MRAKVILLAMAMILPMMLSAQQKQGPKLPVKVSNVTLTDLNKKPAGFADYGRKHLMIFYVDPDAHKQNKQFADDLETNGRAVSPNIQGYAVLNLKDTALPNGIVRSMADKRTKGKPSINLADADHILRDAWALGDCNNKFCLLFVTREGELVYFRAGEFTEQDKTDFYDTVERYK
jgi:hypothetical protein